MCKEQKQSKEIMTKLKHMGINFSVKQQQKEKDISTNHEYNLNRRVYEEGMKNQWINDIKKNEARKKLEMQLRGEITSESTGFTQQNFGSKSTSS